MRFFAEIAYRGTNYQGWQKQPEGATVQQTLEEAFAALLKTDISLTASGRTDTGVHALQQFAHFDLDDLSDPTDLAYRLNAILPPDIAVKRIFPVRDGAHARFNAASRTYVYRLATRKDPFATELAWQVSRKPDLQQVNEASLMLLGHKDFQCFSKIKTDVKTYNCTVEKAGWTVQGDEMTFTITANRFLRNMIRAVVGTLLDVGYGKIPPEALRDIIRSKDRRRAGASVPAKGLFLAKVDYPEKLFT